MKTRSKQRKPDQPGKLAKFGVKILQIDSVFRIILLIAAMAVLALLCLMRLMQVQIVDGASYAALSQKTFTAMQSVQAARGQIFDVNGTPLNTNKIVYKVIVQRAFLPAGSENTVIFHTLDILSQCGEDWIDTVPITLTKPYAFLPEVSDSDLDAFKSKLELNVDASAQNCMDRMRDLFQIGGGYSENEARLIAGVRYEMLARDFSFSNRYTLTEDVQLSTVVKLKERRDILPGIDIIEEPMRVYYDGSLAAHTRGTIGAISAEEYETLKSGGYSLSDTLGKSGVESAMESVLRGQNGVRTIVRNSGGTAISDEITTQVSPGNSVRLTIDSGFQSTLQTILENHIKWLHTTDKTVRNEKYQRGLETQGGAVVVLEVATGKVLGMASYPTYDINDLVENYASVLNAELNPLFNRATMGLYRPGSTFKTITATAALLYGAITRNSTVTCGGKFTLFDDYQPLCTGTHGSLSVVGALQVSCNIFFYQSGLNTGIDNLADTAHHFGFGEDLGLETGGAVSQMTTPDVYQQTTGKEFTSGDVLQASIGQSETYVTPLNLALQALTIANHGVRLRPYLVDSVWNYDGTQLIYRNEPTVADTFLIDRPDIYDTVIEGMIRVTDYWVWPPDDMAKGSIFKYLPYEAACKTGSPQVGDGTYNSTIVGFYPAENPVIAFGIVLENSDFSRYMVRNIIDAYFYDRYIMPTNEEGLFSAPWQPWSEQEVAKYTAN
jgi:penicillin-binding protein 2